LWALSEAGSLVSWSSPCWEKRRTAVQQDSGDEVKSGKEQTLQKREAAQVAQWDMFTLRQWFNIMDVDGDGSITRHEWLKFLVKHPKLRDVFLGDSGQPVKNRFSQAGSQQIQAFRMEQVVTVLKDVFDNSETIGFEDFLDFFRRTGHLMEYQSDADANPRMHMADLLGVLHNIDKVVVCNAQVQLVRQNLQGHKTLEWNMWTTTRYVDGQRVLRP